MTMNVKNKLITSQFVNKETVLLPTIRESPELWNGTTYIAVKSS